MSWTQFNLRVTDEIKAEYERLCQAENISMAKAFIRFVEQSAKNDRLIGRESVSNGGNDERLKAIEDRLDALEKLSKGNDLQQELDRLIDDRDNLLIRIAEMDTRHQKEAISFYDEANSLNSKLEARIDDLDKANTALERENQWLEQKLASVSSYSPERTETIDAIAPPSSDRFSIVNPVGDDLHYWDGRSWIDSPEKAKIYEGETNAKRSLSRIKAKYPNVEIHYNQ